MPAPRPALLCLAALLLLTSRPTLCEDTLTPLTAVPLHASTSAFLGTDGKLHVVYELDLTNTRPTKAILKSIQIVNAASPTTVYATYQDAELLQHLRSMANAASKTAELNFEETRLLLVNIALPAGTPLPMQLAHHFDLLAAPRPGYPSDVPVPQNYTVAPVTVDSDIPVLEPPLAGKGWVAINGCCEPSGAHRATGLPVNGRIHFAQRFAIDWMRLDSQGRLVNGDLKDVHNYPDYGASVLAVADGTVVDTLDTLDDQLPGQLPDPKAITLENVDGNHIVLDIGHGRYAFYAHLQRGSLLIRPGDHVKRGQILAKLGNTGNSSAPHLHFHIMDSPSVLGSSGLPYVIDHFALAGQISVEQYSNAPGIEGTWGQGMLPHAADRQSQYPLNLNIVDF